MKNSLMYKMSYYRFVELFGGQPGQDRVRQQRLPAVGPTLDVLGTFHVNNVVLTSKDEAFTSENWIVRIYKVKKEDSLGREHKAVSAFNSGKRLKKAKSSVGGKKKRPTT
jgi:dolichyl-diphosphooligosaccharide--protein glycosyltransferase